MHIDKVQMMVIGFGFFEKSKGHLVQPNSKRCIIVGDNLSLERFIGIIRFLVKQIFKNLGSIAILSMQIEGQMQNDILQFIIHPNTKIDRRSLHLTCEDITIFLHNDLSAQNISGDLLIRSKSTIIPCIRNIDIFQVTIAILVGRNYNRFANQRF